MNTAEKKGLRIWKKNSKEYKWTDKEGENSRINEQQDKRHITKER